MLGNTISSMQDRMFSAFLIILIPPIIMNSVVPKFYINRALWEAREYPSRIYGWVAFCTANIVCEIPAAIITGLIYWLLWYYPVGLPTDSSSAGYVFLMTMLFFLFQASWGQWICAFAPSFTVISNVSLPCDSILEIGTSFPLQDADNILRSSPCSSSWSTSSTV